MYSIQCQKGTAFVAHTAHQNNLVSVVNLPIEREDPKEVPFGGLQLCM